ncbi:MAG: hypothetical protein ABF979_12665 [Gluconobacter sp.]|uniref:hypothetical protein n=1 Tax=Gluconobacter sp. TaxID=1876758 RepID=UPI0039E85F88
MLSPEPCGGEAEEVHERQGSFVVADCDTAHLLVSVEHPLDAVAVGLPVCFLRRHFGPFAWATKCFRMGPAFASVAYEWGRHHRAVDRMLPSHQPASDPYRFAIERLQTAQ